MQYGQYNAYQNPYIQPYPQQPYVPQQVVQPQQQMQAQRQQQVQQQQYEAPIQDLRFATLEEAKAYIVMPNTRALLIDRQNGIALMKSADNIGQSFAQYFKFIPVNEDGSPISPPKEQPQIDFSEFIKKSDVQSFNFATKEDYKQLNDKIESLRSQIAGGRQNVGTKQ